MIKSPWLSHTAMNIALSLLPSCSTPRGEPCAAMYERGSLRAEQRGGTGDREGQRVLAGSCFLGSLRHTVLSLFNTPHICPTAFLVQIQSPAGNEQKLNVQAIPSPAHTQSGNRMLRFHPRGPATASQDQPVPRSHQEGLPHCSLSAPRHAMLCLAHIGCFVVVVFKGSKYKGTIGNANMKDIPNIH